MYVTQFEVKGLVQFPIDMLRYDGCFPSDGESASAIGLSMDREYRQALRKSGKPVRFHVKLTAYHKRARWTPTADRWRSFNWMVSKIYPTVK